jgi:hypothetical protein
VILVGVFSGAIAIGDQSFFTPTTLNPHDVFVVKFAGLP